jgi:hypothetical protein
MVPKSLSNREEGDKNLMNHICNILNLKREHIIGEFDRR